MVNLFLSFLVWEIKEIKASDCCIVSSTLLFILRQTFNVLLKVASSLQSSCLHHRESLGLQVCDIRCSRVLNLVPREQIPKRSQRLLLHFVLIVSSPALAEPSSTPHPPAPAGSCQLSPTASSEHAGFSGLAMLSLNASN